MNARSSLAVRMARVDKAFGPVLATKSASLEVQLGEIHALVGENGAGKSTLMRILGGLIAPDAGRVEVFGREVTGWTTRAAIQAGVGVVHQHFMLVRPLTVAENVVLGQEPKRFGLFDKAAARRAVAELIERTGLRVPVDRPVSELSVGGAQRVEILKTLYRGAKLLVLDEPTAVLSPVEVRELWGVLRSLQSGGATVVLITHKLDEVMEISSRVTVMRRGETIVSIATRETSPTELARAMVGRAVALASQQRQAEPVKQKGSALEVRDLLVAGARRARAVDSVSLTVAPGEILGVAGVEGNGQTELVEAIAGLRPASFGSIRLGGREVATFSVRERIAAGFSHIPEDRQRRGLVLDYSVAENLVLGLQERFCRHGILDRRAIAERARRLVAEFDIRPADAQAPARALSGGNQQKVVIAREMGRDFQVLLAAQPTRGVDVGAIEFIHGRLREARAAGKTILLVSADLNEVLALSDRIAVMYGGRLVALLPRAEATVEILGAQMTGAGRKEAA